MTDRRATGRTHYADTCGYQFGFKLLTRRQLRETVEAVGDDSIAFEDEVCRLCVTQMPSDFPGFDDCLAGVPTELCAQIMAQSGYAAPETDPVTGAPVQVMSPLEEAAMQWAMTSQARLDTLIVFCFPRLSYETLEDLDPEFYYQYAAGSQLIIGGVYGMDASTFLDPSKDGRPGPPKGAPPGRGTPQNPPYMIE